jgi:hypothetical protein
VTIPVRLIVYIIIILHYYYYFVQGLNSGPTPCTTPPAHFVLGIFEIESIVNYLPGVALNLDPPDLCRLSSSTVNSKHENVYLFSILPTFPLNIYLVVELLSTIW